MPKLSSSNRKNLPPVIVGSFIIIGILVGMIVDLQSRPKLSRRIKKPDQENIDQKQKLVG